MRMRAFSMVFVLLAAVAAHAQTRTTPVEVKSPISIDQTNNSVKATQNGTWNVGVTGTPNVNVANTPAVTVTNSPTVTISGTPSVNLATSPTVKIDPTNNTVKTPTQCKVIQLWANDMTASQGTNAWRYDLDCSGYREARFVLRIEETVDFSKVQCGVEMYSPTGQMTFLGYANFSTPTSSIVDGASFTPASGTCVFTLPVVTNTLAIFVQNTNTTAVTLDKDRCWVYLVN